jgi:catechol 2,3-dioxygenase-like lactoylglutathione lyase family enzyme
MAGELTFSILPCPDLDEATGFYEALGFRTTYRQRRPNPYAVVVRDDIQIHLAAIDGFDPAGSYGSVIIVVPDVDALYADFAARLRAAFGKLPVAGIPRILRPRKKFGTVRGFSVVDPGGNWLRISRLGDTEEDASAERTTGLARVLENAARLGDAKGDDAAALRVLDAGLLRFPDAPESDRAEARRYRDELAERLRG